MQQGAEAGECGSRIHQNNGAESVRVISEVGGNAILLNNEPAP
jgi:hypothetical protein